VWFTIKRKERYMPAPKDWFVIMDKNGEFYAIEDKHTTGKEPKIAGGGEVVGVCSFKKAKDAIDHIKWVLSGGR
jgi:hypothetical protein